MVETETRIKVTCSCGCGGTVTWTQEDAQNNPDAVPEEFFRLLTISRSYMDPELKGQDPGQYVFLTAACAANWLKNIYIPSVSPKEKAKKMAAQVSTFQTEAKDGGN